MAVADQSTNHRADRTGRGPERPGPSTPADGRALELCYLIKHPATDPSTIAFQAWAAVLDEPRLKLNDEASEAADWLERNDLALTLLRECVVTSVPAELLLTRVRRHLLISESWGEYPNLCTALAAQAQHNYGAWPFDEEEGRRLETAPHLIRQCYEPEQLNEHGYPGDGDVVRHQYRRWPFPPWSRVGRIQPTDVEQLYRELGVVLPRSPVDTLKILVAGCGTGKEVATLRGQFPEARIIAVDFSETSLAYASKRCDPSATEFHLLDLRRVAELGEKFDLIFCSGVLHHLDDPLKGWQALVGVLEDSGLMRIMLYSEAGRFPLKVARSRIRDLRDGPMDAGRLREIRKRFLETGAGLVSGYADFFTLPGVYDLLVHSREQCFTVDSIHAALDSLNLKLLKFELPSAEFEARYQLFNPSDARQRDYAGWHAFEEENPYVFRSMYVFWCGKTHGLCLV